MGSILFHPYAARSARKGSEPRDFSAGRACGDAQLSVVNKGSSVVRWYSF